MSHGQSVRCSVTWRHMILGDWQLDTVSGGTLRLDGGAMFGVVPKLLWQEFEPPDAENRIGCATNCVLARNENHCVLIDTGYGGKLSPQEKRIFSAEEGSPLVSSLRALGVSVDDVDTVILSHLHFDHVGGGTSRRESGEIVPTFPRARYVAQRGELELALADLPELKGSYPKENLVPLVQGNKFHLLDGDGEILPGIRGLVTGGHTQWHQAIKIGSGESSALYLGDLCPYAAHLRRLWCMAYDLYPLETRRRKPEFLGAVADQGWLLLFDHDPRLAACRLARDAKREFVITESIARL